jgi:hypothetical protein
MPSELESLLAELEEATRQLEAAAEPEDLAQALSVRSAVLSRIPYPLPPDEAVLVRFHAVRDAGGRVQRNLVQARQEAMAEWLRWERVRQRLASPSEPTMIDCQG